jgi:hypothetical protein
MSNDVKQGRPDEPIEIDLRQPGLAALWAWLWPGAGHLYQRRYAKGVLFMTCILSVYFFGLAMGAGRVVYASWTETDKRWQYFCQLGVGLPALPALVQARRVMGGKDPFFPKKKYMAPPHPVLPYGNDELAKLHEQYHLYFELGTLFTMIAGLLNVLAIYDAYSGPVMGAPDPKGNKPPPESSRSSKER